MTDAKLALFVCGIYFPPVMIFFKFVVYELSSRNAEKKLNASHLTISLFVVYILSSTNYLKKSSATSQKVLHKSKSNDKVRIHKIVRPELKLVLDYVKLSYGTD